MIATNIRCTVLTLTFFLLPVMAFAQSAHVEYKESLQQFELRRGAQLGHTQAVAGLDRSGPVEAMRFNAFGKHFDVQLAPNQNILSTKVREHLAAGVGVFRGSVRDMPGSWVRVVVANDVPRGLLWDGTSMYAIEAGDDAAGKPYIFRLDDLQVPAGSMTCTQPTGKQTATDLLKAVAKDVTPRVVGAPGAVSNIDVAVIADFEFASDKGSNAQTEIVTRMNNIDGIFSAQLGVQINVARTDVFSSSNDPFTDESDSGNLLGELTDYRSANATQNANGLSHLFTGRDLDGSTVGIAYTGAICSSRVGAGLTQGTHSATVDSLIAAHEIGHNFGAPHDGTPGSACEDTSEDFLMAARLNGSDTFSACSITQMQDDVSRAPCITALSSLDVAVVANQAGNVLLGDPAVVTFVVNSVGTDGAAGVNFDVSVPAIVGLDSITSSTGSCSNGGGTASCSIGSIGAGSNATVNLTVTSTSTGAASFAATVSASGDNNSGNDQATLNLTIDPAVDLVASAAASTVILDQSTTARVTIENRASIAATSASVTITAGSGIRIDSADWTAGSCSVLGGVVTCDATSLAALSNNTINVQLTGLTEGNQSYDVSASATETDRVSGNNATQGQVTVNLAQASNDGGGGAIGLLQLFGLMLVLLVRRQR